MDTIGRAVSRGRTVRIIAPENIKSKAATGTTSRTRSRARNGPMTRAASRGRTAVRVEAESPSPPITRTASRGRSAAGAGTNAALAKYIEKNKGARAVSRMRREEIVIREPRETVAESTVKKVGEEPLFIYWTDNRFYEKSDEQIVFQTPVTSFKDGNVTPFLRKDLERRILKDRKYCGSNINDEYLVEHLSKDENPYLLVLTGIQKTKDAVPKSKGFIIAHQSIKDGKTGMYLDVICTDKGLGKILLNFFEYFVLTHLSLKFVELSSLANVLTYYPKFGYEFRKICKGDPLATLSDALVARTTARVPAPPDTTSSYNDKDYMNFMYDVLYKTADLGVRTTEDCKRRKPFLSKDEFKKRDCAQDGFTMMKCRTTPKSVTARAGAGKYSRRTRKNK